MNGGEHTQRGRKRTLCRSQAGIIGGVGAGIAEYFGTDALAIRILMVLVALLMPLVMLVVYAALWAVLPKAPLAGAPFEVKPSEAHSDHYGAAPGQPSKAQARKQARACVDASRGSVYGAYGGIGHKPPEPPEAYKRR